jgi:ABC-type antimicrobial peptide transport system permease subunit
MQQYHLRNTIQLNGITFKVVGVSNQLYVESVFVPVGILSHLYESMPTPRTFSVLLMASQGYPPTAAAEELRQSILSVQPLMRSYTTQMTANTIQNNMANVYAVDGFALIVLLITGINVSNLCTFWVLDKRREIGIRKAVGGSNLRIALSILLEIMSFPVISLALAIVVQAILAHFISHLIQYSVNVTWWNIGIGLLVSLVSGGISALAPALSTLRMTPVTAIRTE